MRISNQKLKYYGLAIFISIFLLILTLILLQNSITCVDENGCLFEHCANRKFNKDYKKIIA